MMTCEIINNRRKFTKTLPSFITCGRNVHQHRVNFTLCTSFAFNSRLIQQYSIIIPIKTISNLSLTENVVRTFQIGC